MHSTNVGVEIEFGNVIRDLEIEFGNVICEMSFGLDLIWIAFVKSNLEMSFVISFGLDLIWIAFVIYFFRLNRIIENPENP